MMDKTNEKDIKPYIDTVDRWRIWKMLVLLPVFISSLIVLPSAFIYLTKQASLNEKDKYVSNFEYNLELPINTLWFISALFCILLLILVVISKKNKIKAIFINNVILTISYFIFYYQIIVALQLFIIYLPIRVINWLLFFLSIVYILYILFTGKYDHLNFITKNRVAIITKIAGVLWIINIIISSFFEGIKNLKTIFWISITPFMPIIVIILSIGLFNYVLASLRFLFEVNRNQEKYRLEYNYSIKEWYGLKSKEYKSERKNRSSI